MIAASATRALISETMSAQTHDPTDLSAVSLFGLTAPQPRLSFKLFRHSPFFGQLGAFSNQGAPLRCREHAKLVCP